MCWCIVLPEDHTPPVIGVAGISSCINISSQHSPLILAQIQQKMSLMQPGFDTVTDRDHYKFAESWKRA